MRLAFRGTRLSSDGGLLAMREVDDALGLPSLASAVLRDGRKGKNTVHRLDTGVSGGWSVGGRAVDAQPASAPPMGRFQTETLGLAENRAALAELNCHRPTGFMIATG